MSDHNRITVKIERSKMRSTGNKKVMKLEYWEVKNREKIDYFADFCAKRIEREAGNVDVGRTVEIMKVAAEKFLLTRVNVRTDCRITRFDKEIEMAIKEIREVNRRRRNERSEERRKNMKCE